MLSCGFLDLFAPPPQPPLVTENVQMGTWERDPQTKIQKKVHKYLKCRNWSIIFPENGGQYNGKRGRRERRCRSPRGIHN